MSEEFSQEAVDSAIILEGQIKRRVREVVRAEVHSVVAEVMRERFNDEKESMLMEICLAVGKAIRTASSEDRKPLWESTPEEFGLTHEELNRSSIRRLDDLQQEINHAIRKQTTPLQERVPAAADPR